MIDTVNGDLSPYCISDGLYNISTAYGRVSFIAQQWRALTLSNALAEKHKGNKETEISIVGGGVAGVTAFVALHMHGFHNAVLYEAQGELLGTQTGCDHRHTHPSMNYWPIEPIDGAGFPATTNLPFLNWKAGSVASVVTQMKEDPFLRILIKEMKKDPKTQEEFGLIQYGMRLSTVGFYKKNHQLVFKDIAGENATRSSKVVVLATGFGQEKNLKSSESKSYWWADHVKHYRTEHHHYGDSTVYISGNGDGALIDFSRFRIKKDKMHDYQEENHALSLLGELRPKAYRHIFDCEDDVPSDEQPEEAIKKLYKDSGNRVKGEGIDAALQFFSDELVSIAMNWRANGGNSRISEFVEKRFRTSINGHRSVKLVVYDEDENGEKIASPPVFRHDASSLNVLLTALLINGGMDAFVENGAVIKASQLIALSGEGQFRTEDVHIARNGTLPEFTKIDFLGADLKDAHKEYETRVNGQLREKREKIDAAWHDYIVKQDSLKLEKYSPKCNKLQQVQKEVLAQTRYGLVHGFFTSIGEHMFLRLRREEAEDTFVVTVPDDVEQVEQRMRDLGGVERLAFGCQVSFEGEYVDGDNTPVEVVNE